VSAIQIVQFGFSLLSSLNVDGQDLRKLEIYVNDEITTVEIDVSQIPYVVENVSEKPHSLPRETSEKPRETSFESEDVIIFGNSKAIVEINNLMDRCIEF
jgi:hypothetical protein